MNLKYSQVRTRSAFDILNDDTIQPRKPLLGDWFHERGLSLVYAPSGVGKSWFGLAIAMAVAGGGKLHTWTAPEARRVLLVDGEMDVSDLKDRLKVVLDASDLSSPEQAAKNFMVCSRRDQAEGVAFPDLGDTEGRAALIQRVRQFRPSLVIVDNVSTLVTVADENAADSWNDFLETLQALQTSGAAVLVIH